VVGIFRIWTGVPDVVYLGEIFALQTEKIFALQIKISNNQIVYFLCVGVMYTGEITVLILYTVYNLQNAYKQTSILLEWIS
jgi:hypothetical protein